ncbi:MAG: hypothetical protein U9N10_11130 [Bacillota bacterium]|nr:hypothetical protein [Bacillota bacterium]
MNKRKVAVIIVVLVLLVGSFTYSNSRIGEKFNDVLFTKISEKPATSVVGWIAKNWRELKISLKIYN